jgi:formylglycine-generating enzyme required for sulfatase activity
VGRFSPNGYGLYDMTGNVWEWTTDFFTPRHTDEVEKTVLHPAQPSVASRKEIFAPERRSRGE